MGNARLVAGGRTEGMGSGRGTLGQGQIKSWDSVAKDPGAGFESRLCYFLAMRPWTEPSVPQSAQL